MQANVAQRQTLSVEAASELVHGALAAGRTVLTEWESKALLAAYGVPVPLGVLVATEEEAAAAAEQLGGKLAMKAVGASILHKTEGGLVVLDVAGPEEASATFQLLAERAGDGLEGVLVERMASGSREFLVGLERDPAYGPVLAFGLGGVLTEAVGDVAFAVAPLDEREARELPERIRARRLLGPFRGAPEVDRAVLARVLDALSRIAADLPEVAEIDVNPLLIDDGEPVAVDALVLLTAEPPAQTAARTVAPDLDAVFSPNSVAIVGASDDLAKWGGSALRNLLDGGYIGRVYPVNPRAEEIFGLKAYPSVEDLPEPVDLALVVVGGNLVQDVVESCVRAQVRSVVVITAGFAETGEEGATVERDIGRMARAAGMTLIGPNCIGLMSNERDLFITGFVNVRPPLANLSLVSQSGSMGPIVVNTCEQRGVGLDKFLSVGNEADVSAFDVLDYLRDDPGTRCAMLYLEGVSDGRHFYDVARRTTAAKPVVVLRGGRTEAGHKAAASHTAALAGSNAVFEAAARQAGVVTCTTAGELVDLSACLAYLPLPQGRRVAVVTNGGGPGVLAADEVALNGLELAELPPALLAELDELLPPFWSHGNPLDLVTAGFGDTGLRIIELLARCDAVDAILALTFLGVPALRGATADTRRHGQYQGFGEWEEHYLEHVVGLMEETGKPIVNVPDHPVLGSILEYGDMYAPVILSSGQAAARALGEMAWYAEYRRAQD
jgi:acyl-CoA synthetase (NDP forming)